MEWEEETPNSDEERMASDMMDQDVQGGPGAARRRSAGAGASQQRRIQDEDEEEAAGESEEALIDALFGDEVPGGATEDHDNGVFDVGDEMREAGREHQQRRRRQQQQRGPLSPPAGSDASGDTGLGGGGRDDESDMEVVAGMRPGPSDRHQAIWARRNARANAQARRDAPSSDDDDDDDDAREGRRQQENHARPDWYYQGYDPTLLKMNHSRDDSSGNGLDPIPFNLPQTGYWTPFTKSSIQARHQRVRWCRAMCLNFPVWFFALDTPFFKKWERGESDVADSCDGRIRQVAALASLLFAGTAKGMDAGCTTEEEEKPDQSGGAQSAKPKAKRITEYTWQALRSTHADDRPDDFVGATWPQFEIAYEEVFDEDEREVLAVRIWKLVYAEHHSDSALLNQVMCENQAAQAAVMANGERMMGRNKAMVGEVQRLTQSGCGPQHVAEDFERLVDMQYKAITCVKPYLDACRVYSGATSNLPGSPLMEDLQKWCCQHTAMDKPWGDKRGYGSTSPIAPEYLFNVRRVADEVCDHLGIAAGESWALRAGLTNPDGSVMKYNRSQTKLSSYLIDGATAGGLPAEDHLTMTLPELSTAAREFFWVSNQRNVNTPFGLRLPQPLTGNVLPGLELLKVVLLHVPSHKPVVAPAASQEGDEDGDDGMDEPNGEEEEAGAEEEDPMDVDPDTTTTDAVEYTRFRSFATNRDLMQDEARATLLSELCPLDGMIKDFDLTEADLDKRSDREFVVRVHNETEKVTHQSNRLWQKACNPYLRGVEKELIREMEALPTDSDDPCYDVERKDWAVKRDSFLERQYTLKSQLAQYHIRMQAGVFHSAVKRRTIPPGHVNMFNCLQELIAANGGSANMAAAEHGRHLTSRDRTVWGHIREWHGEIFSNDLKIKGRDMRVPETLYASHFEAYTPQTWMVVCCSKRGTGKSMTAERFGDYMPPKTVVWNAGSSEKAGMNGNNAPSNGAVVVYDEAPGDIVSPDPTNRGEFWKQILSRREYELERTVPRKTASGTEVHVTVKIVTSHKEVHQVMCNLGPQLTVGGLPSQSKEALVQRSTCIFARDQTSTPSDSAEFKAHMNQPETQKRRDMFRLYTCLCDFVRLCICGVDWLQPDLAFAKQLWREWDNNLVTAHTMARPEPRRVAKRVELLVSYCVMEAVARIYLFRETAVMYECSYNADGTPKAFDFGDLWHVIRTAHPTREMALAAWSAGLEYTVGTSMHGTNVMTSLCQKAGITLDKCLLRLPTAKADQEMARCEQEQSSWYMIGMLNSEQGATNAELKNLGEALARVREDRATFRRIAKHQAGVAPLHAIRNVVEAENARRAPDDQLNEARITNALFPTMAGSVIYYKEHALLRWLNCRPLTRSAIDSTTLTGSHPVYGHHTELSFHAWDKKSGDAKYLDLAWLVVESCTEKREAFNKYAEKLGGDKTACDLMGMHMEGISDTLQQLSGVENCQRICEMPHMPSQMVPRLAFEREGEEATGLQSLGVRKHSLHDGTQHRLIDAAAHNAHDPVVARDPNHMFKTTQVPMHAQLDRLVARGRLPALLPAVSTNIKTAAPLRHDSDNGIELNSSRAMDWAMQVVEASLTLQSMPGVANMQERFSQGNEGPQAFIAPKSAYALRDDPTEEQVKQLPFSIDLMQIWWTREAASWLYDSQRPASIDRATQQLAQMPPSAKAPKSVVLPELTFNYPGYQKDDDKGESGKSAATPGFLSMPVQDAKPAQRREVRVEDSDVTASMSQQDLERQCRTAIGRQPTEAEVNNYARSKAGVNYTFETCGDLFDAVTWRAHARNSLAWRGMSDGSQSDIGVMIGVVDSEMMLSVHLQALQIAANPDNNTAGVMPITAVSTYGNMEKEVADADELQRQAEASRKRKAAAQEMLAVSGKRNVPYTRKGAQARPATYFGMPELLIGAIEDLFDPDGSETGTGTSANVSTEREQQTSSTGEGTAAGLQDLLAVHPAQRRNSLHEA